MKNVLVVMNATEVTTGGGITQVILNIKKALSNERNIHMDFAMNTKKTSSFPNQLKEGGSKFYQLPDKRKNIICYIKCLTKVCRRGYDCIHVHGSSSTMLLELCCAKRAGIKTRIAHCHNSTCTHPVLNWICNPLFRNSYTRALACSEAAGKWIFGENNYQVLHNAFPYMEYAYNEEARYEQQNRWNCAGNTVFAIVGNLNEQKNPFFSLDIFYRYHQKNPLSKLLIVGDGIYKQEMREKVKKWKIMDDVLFLGVRSDVALILQAVDIFLFPSKWEGLGISILEAQAAGCICIASDQVPSETKMLESTRYLSLNNEKWMDVLDNIKITSVMRKRYSQFACVKLSENYDLKKETKKLYKIYGVN